ncbi:hypothetical protein chiPu_0022551 [Chiloscyllium punctatum]|uniref:Uncharacterized protein n=1 Tax=Chiloscyllium punctatum TaxID=137246 RepID=A0A401RDU4_CHIPU|nr:hypothetical protein [Chiloscyllium punctatum]
MGTGTRGPGAGTEEAVKGTKTFSWGSVSVTSPSQCPPGLCPQNQGNKKNKNAEDAELTSHPGPTQHKTKIQRWVKPTGFLYDLGETGQGEKLKWGALQRQPDLPVTKAALD